MPLATLGAAETLVSLGGLFTEFISWAELRFGAGTCTPLYILLDLKCRLCRCRMAVCAQARLHCHILVCPQTTTEWS